MADELIALIDSYVKARQVKEEAESVFDQAKEALEAAEAALWDYMETKGVETVRSTVGIISRKETVYGRISDLEAAKRSFEDMGRLEEFFSLQPEKARINEYVRECMKQGVPLPEGVDFYSKRYVSLTKR